jgi:hypothetical protein
MELDRDLKALCTVWIMVTQKGHAAVHFLGMNKYRNKVLTPKKHSLKWTAIDDPQLDEVSEYLANRKREILEDGDEGYVDPEQLDQAVDRAETDTRNELIQSVYDETSVTQQELANAVGLSRSRVADLLNS